MLTPGPAPVPEETLLELARPVNYHRSPEARQVLAEVLEGLRHIYQTKNPIAPLTCSGTGSLEAALVNAAPAGSKAIICIAGKFGERWRNIAQAFGIEAISITVPYGKAVRPEQVEKALAEHPDAVAVCATLSETSTGVGHDLEAYGRIVARTPALLLCDAISGLGAMECRTDAWNIDLCCAGSQKALMMPPGLAFVSISDKAWQAMTRNPPPRAFYFDLRKARKSLETHDTPYTPAHTLIRGMRLSVKRLVDEGIENVWRRQAQYAAAARAGFQGMGLEIFPEPPNTALTVAKVPDGLDGNALLARIESKYGIKLANGQDSLKGKIMRLGHLGYIDQFDILAALSAVELVLAEMGHRVEIGKGLSAAQRVFANR